MYGLMGVWSAIETWKVTTDQNPNYSVFPSSHKPSVVPQLEVGLVNPSPSLVKCLLALPSSGNHNYCEFMNAKATHVQKAAYKKHSILGCI